MHIKIGYPDKIWRVSLVFLLNLILSPISILIAIIRCPISCPSREEIKSEIRTVMEEEIDGAHRGDNISDINLENQEEEEYLPYTNNMPREEVKRKWFKNIT